MERHGLAVTVDGWLLNVAITVIPVFDTEGHVAAVLTVDREELFGEGTDPMSQSTAHHIKRVLGEPIGQIANAATLLARPQVFSDSVQRGRLLSTLKETAREACALIESLSDTMSFEAAQTSEHRALTDVGAMLADVAGLYGTSPGEVMVDFQPEETYAMVDRTAVSRALKAMLRCAVVSSVDGKIRATASLWMPGDVVVQVSYRAVQASDDVGSAGRGGNEVARDAWNGLRYVRAVADGHGGSVDILTGTNGDVTLQMTLPGENKSE